MDSESQMALVLVDVLNDFRHEDGTTLSKSFRDRLPALRRLIQWARAEGLPVLYVNDALGESRCGFDCIVVADACATVDGRLEEIARSTRLWPHVHRDRAAQVPS